MTDNTVTPIAVELLEREAGHLAGYDPRDWRGVRLAAVNTELRQLRHQSPMRVWSVTASWEDEREGQWVQTFATLAENEAEARTYIREYIRESQVLGRTAEIEIESTLWQGSQAPRIIARLTVDGRGNPSWKPEPRSEGEIGL